MYFISLMFFSAAGALAVSDFTLNLALSAKDFAAISERSL